MVGRGFPSGSLGSLVSVQAYTFCPARQRDLEPRRGRSLTSRWRSAMRWKPRPVLLVTIASIVVGAGASSEPALARCAPPPPPPVCPNDALLFSNSTDL